MNRLFIFVMLFLLFSCDTINLFNKKEKNADPDVRIIREYHNNGKIKSIIEAKETKRHGITKNYNAEGKLISTIHFEDNKLHGTTTNYYPSGKVHSKIEYFENRKNGVTVLYNEKGKIYKKIPYENGLIDGTVYKYYNNGNLQAEIPYISNEPQAGLKEYTENGDLITSYPSIVIREIDQIAMTNKFILQISMSNKTRKAEYYYSVDGKDFKIPIESNSDKGELEFYVSPGTIKMEKLTFFAETKSKLGNKFVTSKRYNLALQN